MTIESIPPLRITTLELAIRPDLLALPDDISAAVQTNWTALSAQNPRLFNGSAFLFDRFAVDTEASGLTAEGAPTDYATFLYWRAHRDTLALKHLFPVGAIVTADQKLLVGRMSAHTANPGRLYPPAGSFDASDLVTGADGRLTLDPAANIAREMHEEIGLDTADFAPDTDWLLFPSNPGAFALVRILRTARSAADLAPAILRHIAADPAEELDDIRFLAFDARLDPRETMPYVNHLLAYLLGTR